MSSIITPDQFVSNLLHLVTQWISRYGSASRQGVELVPRPGLDRPGTDLEREAPARRVDAGRRARRQHREALLRILAGRQPLGDVAARPSAEEASRDHGFGLSCRSTAMNWPAGAARSSLRHRGGAVDRRARKRVARTAKAAAATCRLCVGLARRPISVRRVRDPQRERTLDLALDRLLQALEQHAPFEVCRAEERLAPVHPVARLEVVELHQADRFL